MGGGEIEVNFVAFFWFRIRCRKKVNFWPFLNCVKSHLCQRGREDGRRRD